MTIINTKYYAEEIIRFRDDRNWDKYHTPENLVKSISIEAAELLELFQWQKDISDLDRIKEELADVMIYSITLAERLGISIDQIIMDKLEKNGIKYPVNSKKIDLG